MTDRYFVNATGLNLRGSPEIVSGNVLEVLRRGRIVTKIDDSAPQSWMKVRTRLGMRTVEGYTAERYLAPDDDAPTSDSGDPIAITEADLRKLAPNGRDTFLSGLPAPLNDTLPNYGITGDLRVAHFLAQAAHETDGLRTLTEYGGEDYFNRRYDGRADLGNTEPGDGARYRGRGIFQLTGRANYRTFGARIGAELEDNPPLAASPEVSVTIACEYWSDRGLNEYADQDDIRAITRRINGGYNGLEDRRLYYRRARQIWNNGAA